MHIVDFTVVCTTEYNDSLRINPLRCDHYVIQIRIVHTPSSALATVSMSDRIISRERYYDSNMLMLTTSKYTWNTAQSLSQLASPWHPYDRPIAPSQLHFSPDMSCPSQGTPLQWLTNASVNTMPTNITASIQLLLTFVATTATFNKSTNSCNLWHTIVCTCIFATR